VRIDPRKVPATINRMTVTVKFGSVAPTNDVLVLKP
jgi:hypothetical protein